MANSRIMGTGMYVPPRVVTNDELAAMMDTSNEWIVQRTGIQERRYVDGEGSSDMGTKAAKAAIEDAGIEVSDIDCIIDATLSPDHCFPGDACFIQHKLGLAEIPAIDVRNQCSGFLYALTIADAFIQIGKYKHILVVGAEAHSTGLDYTDRGRGITVLFGDGAGAAVLGPAKDGDKGVILNTQIHAEGEFAKKLWTRLPSSCEDPRTGKGGPDVDEGWYPEMNGRFVFFHAVKRMIEAIKVACEGAGKTLEDIDLIVPHQANLRINESVANQMDFPLDKVFNNIQRYGNTTAATIPIALTEARQAGKVPEGAFVVLVAFGAGFTWGSVAIQF